MILYMLHETMAAAGVPANRVDRARKIRRKDTTFRQTTGNIAAIDFGTKNCSLAYVTVNDPRALDLLGGTLPKLPLNDTYSRVPTVVLLNAGGRTEQLGHFARSAYLNLDDREKKMVAYFDKLKMNLARDAVSARVIYCHRAGVSECDVESECSAARVKNRIFE